MGNFDAILQSDNSGIFRVVLVLADLQALDSFSGRLEEQAIFEIRSFLKIKDNKRM